jgi:hypothetical protein
MNVHHDSLKKRAMVIFLWPTEKSQLPIFLYKFLIFEILTHKSNSQPNFDLPENPEFGRVLKLDTNPFGSELLIYV